VDEVMALYAQAVDKKGMALRAGMVALSTKLKTGSQRLWLFRAGKETSEKHWIPWLNQRMTRNQAPRA
jgi:hypothetical protein